MFLDRFLFELSCKNTHGNTHTHTHTHTHMYIDAHKGSNEYSTVALCKNATIMKLYAVKTLICVSLTLQLLTFMEVNTGLCCPHIQPRDGNIIMK